MSGSQKSHKRFGTRSTQAFDGAVMVGSAHELQGFQRFEHKFAVETQAGKR